MAAVWALGLLIWVLVCLALYKHKPWPKPIIHPYRCHVCWRHYKASWILDAHIIGQHYKRERHLRLVK